MSLEAKEAKVSYSSGDVTADQIAMYIEEMGFDAFVMEVNGRNLRPPEISSTSVTNGTVAIPMSGAGDGNREEQRLSKCFLHIKVREVLKINEIVASSIDHRVSTGLKKS